MHGQREKALEARLDLELHLGATLQNGRDPQKAAPFKRNDAMLQTLPIGVVAFPGSGITENLADKARQMGIPVWRFGGDGAQASSLPGCPLPVGGGQSVDAAAVRKLTWAAYAKWVPIIGRKPRPVTADHDAAVRDDSMDLLQADGDTVALIEAAPADFRAWRMYDEIATLAQTLRAG